MDPMAKLRQLSTTVGRTASGKFKVYYVWETANGMGLGGNYHYLAVPGQPLRGFNHVNDAKTFEKTCSKLDKIPYGGYHIPE